MTYLEERRRMILKKKPQLVDVFQSYNERVALERKNLIKMYLFLILLGGLIWLLI